MHAEDIKAYVRQDPYFHRKLLAINDAILMQLYLNNSLKRLAEFSSIFYQMLSMPRYRISLLSYIRCSSLKAFFVKDRLKHQYFPERSINLFAACLGNIGLK